MSLPVWSLTKLQHATYPILKNHGFWSYIHVLKEPEADWDKTWWVCFSFKQIHVLLKELCNITVTTLPLRTSPLHMWAQFIRTNWLKSKNFLPSSQQKEWWSDGPCTKIQVILIPRKGCCTGAISGRKIHGLEKKRKYGVMPPRDKRGKWGRLEALTSILLVLRLQWITKA